MKKYNIKKLFTENYSLSEFYKHETTKFLMKYKKYLSFDNGVVLAGGALRSLLLNESPADFDLFAKNEENLRKMMPVLEKNGFKKISENDYNISFENENKQKVQLIKFYHRNIKSLLDSFDFTICQFVVNDASSVLIASDTSLSDLKRKRLVINQISFGVSSLRRIIKYIKKGFYACDGTLNTFLNQIVEDPDRINQDVVSID